MSDPAPVTVVYPNTHLIAGRGRSIGGLTGLIIYISSYALWAYFWAVFAAETIFFVRSGYDLILTLEHAVPLIIHPFIAVPMELLVVMPYRYIWCPFNLWWANLSIPWLKKPAKGSWTSLTEAEKQAQLKKMATPSSVQPLIERTVQDAEYIWDHDLRISEGQGWVNPLNKKAYCCNQNSGFAYSWALPPDNKERIYLNDVFEAMAEPVYDATVAYKPPKYCKLPGEPFARGCNPRHVVNGKVTYSEPTSMFSMAYWFCRAPHLTHCSVPCNQ